MATKLGILNYKTAGNIASVKRALEYAGSEVILVDSPKELKCVSKLVLPGVGSFFEAMQELKNTGYVSAVNEVDYPVLGICLGMQVLARIGYENGRSEGFSLIDGEVKPIECEGKVPHMGFNKLSVLADGRLLSGIEDESFYFMHSYELVNYTNITSLTEYNGHQFVSSIEKENIFGVQFHPEKSRDAGIQLLTNFINI